MKTQKKMTKTTKTFRGSKYVITQSTAAASVRFDHYGRNGMFHCWTRYPTFAAALRHIDRLKAIAICNDKLLNAKV
jgi:hypothetical protein